MYRQLNGPFPEDHWQRLVSKTDYSLAEGEIDQNIAVFEYLELRERQALQWFACHHIVGF